MNFIVIIFIYTLIDIRLQKLEEYNQIKENKIVKIINDMQTPLGELLKTANQQNLSNSNSSILSNIETMIDKLDNFWTDFKSWRLIDVDIGERVRKILTAD